MACFGSKPIKVLFKDLSFRMKLINHKNVETYAINQRTSSKEDQVLCQVTECLEVQIQVVPG
jgi:hypothetical protein